MLTSTSSKPELLIQAQCSCAAPALHLVRCLDSCFFAYSLHTLACQGGCLFICSRDTRCRHMSVNGLVILDIMWNCTFAFSSIKASHRKIELAHALDCCVFTQNLVPWRKDAGLSRRMTSCRHQRRLHPAGCWRKDSVPPLVQNKIGKCTRQQRCNNKLLDARPENNHERSGVLEGLGAESPCQPSSLLEAAAFQPAHVVLFVGILLQNDMMRMQQGLHASAMHSKIFSNDSCVSLSVCRFLKYMRQWLLHLGTMLKPRHSIRIASPNNCCKVSLGSACKVNTCCFCMVICSYVQLCERGATSRYLRPASCQEFPVFAVPHGARFDFMSHEVK